MKSADAEEDKGRVDAQLSPLVEVVKETAVLIPYGVGHQAGQGEVHQQHPKGDGDEQVGLKALFDGEIKEDTGDTDHDKLPGEPQAEQLGVALDQLGKAGAFPEALE